jgi:Zn-dependent protease with chaperone function
MARLKTTLLLGGLTALVLAVGYYFGGQQGALIALILSAIMNFGSYWFSDKIVLALYGAKKLHGYSRSRPLIGEPKYEATAHLFIVNPFKPSFLMNLFSTHPPIEKRIKKLEAIKLAGR